MYSQDCILYRAPIRKPFSLRVLVVEDEAMISGFLGDVLTTMGHQVCASAQAEDEAVAAAQHTRPDLMIVDVNLSSGSGLAAIDRISRAGFLPHIPMSGDRATLAARDHAVTITKPFTERNLAGAINRAMQTSYQPAR